MNKEIFAVFAYLSVLCVFVCVRVCMHDEGPEWMTCIYTEHAECRKSIIYVDKRLFLPRDHLLMVQRGPQRGSVR